MVYWSPAMSGGGDGFNFRTVRANTEDFECLASGHKSKVMLFQYNLALAVAVLKNQGGEWFS